MAEVAEHSNVTVQCQANGHPRPSVVWRRDDGLPIRLSGLFNSSSQSSDSQAQVTTPNAINIRKSLFGRPLGS